MLSRKMFSALYGTSVWASWWLGILKSPSKNFTHFLPWRIHKKIGKKIQNSVFFHQKQKWLGCFKISFTYLGQSTSKLDFTPSAGWVLNPGGAPPLRIPCFRLDFCWFGGWKNGDFTMVESVKNHLKQTKVKGVNEATCAMFKTLGWHEPWNIGWLMTGSL